MNTGTQVKIVTSDENNGKIGTVEQIHRDGFGIYIPGDEDNKFFTANELRLVSDNAATQKQIDYIIDLGGNAGPLTKQQASVMIDDLKPACHYCGMPAVKMNFFDVHVCADCG